LLTRAARSGSAEALALLGQSYDAAALSELGVKGVRPDAAEARKYYQQAAAAGSTDAKRRLAKLGD
jgi:TPR repeat protein